MLGVHVRLFAAPWTVVHQALLSMHSQGKNIGKGCHALLLTIFPTQRSNPCLLHLLHCQVGSLPLALPGKPLKYSRLLFYLSSNSTPGKIPLVQWRIYYVLFRQGQPHYPLASVLCTIQIQWSIKLLDHTPLPLGVLTLVIRESQSTENVIYIKYVQKS